MSSLASRWVHAGTRIRCGRDRDGHGTRELELNFSSPKYRTIMEVSQRINQHSKSKSKVQRQRASGFDIGAVDRTT